jgi:hypothetical protein
MLIKKLKRGEINLLYIKPNPDILPVVEYYKNLTKDKSELKAIEQMEGICSKYTIPFAKIGITRLEASENRMSTNANACGVLMPSEFTYGWLGAETPITEIETEIKARNDHKILMRGRGFTEWIHHMTAFELSQKVEDLIVGLRSKVMPVEKADLPITIDNINEIKAKYLP